MKRFITTAVFTIAIVILYQFIDINLFTIDLPRRVSSELFKSLRYDPELDTNVVIFDIEYIDLDTIKTKLELLESLGPKSIGVNLCNIEDTSEVLNEFLSQSKTVVTCNCMTNAAMATSAVTTSGNEVTHFKSDNLSAFEFQLASELNALQTRGNKKERINFRPVDAYYRVPMSLVEGLPPYVVQGKTILVGFLRDSIVTPMNDWYGRTGPTRGDMSDAQISANIISTIDRHEFINEVNLFVRVSIILAVSLVCAGLIRLARTKSLAINFILALLILIILSGLSSYLIVLAFSRSYFLELNEMTVVLIVSAILSVYWNTKDRKAPAHNGVHMPLPAES